MRKADRKPRHQKCLLEENLGNKFVWINTIRHTNAIIVTSQETFDVTFRTTPSATQRQEFEKFVQDFYETTPYGKHQVVCCWKENSLTLIVF